MPELSKEGRQQGAWVNPDRPSARKLYGPADAGDVCAGCGEPMIAALQAVEPYDTHPSCDPEHAVLAALLTAGPPNSPPPANRAVGPLGGAQSR